jgi:hypothetical protein
VWFNLFAHLDYHMSGEKGWRYHYLKDPPLCPFRFTITWRILLCVSLTLPLPEGSSFVSLLLYHYLKILLCVPSTLPLPEGSSFVSLRLYHYPKDPLPLWVEVYVCVCLIIVCFYFVLLYCMYICCYELRFVYVYICLFMLDDI